LAGVSLDIIVIPGNIIALLTAVSGIIILEELRLYTSLHHMVARVVYILPMMWMYIFGIKNLVIRMVFKFLLLTPLGLTIFLMLTVMLVFISVKLFENRKSYILTKVELPFG
jgi:hypothetical protein